MNIVYESTLSACAFFSVELNGDDVM